MNTVINYDEKGKVKSFGGKVKAKDFCLQVREIDEVLRGL